MPPDRNPRPLFMVPVRCPKCGWAGKASEAICPPRDVVRCWRCQTTVEKVEK